MYKSPIEIAYAQMQTQIEGDILRVVQNYVPNVDKEELIRSLKYDREQYEKGFKDGVASVERPKGRWIKEHLVGCEPYYLCSLCGKLHDQDYNFCNNCGADMRGESE